ncbi:MAG TPA: hypothetical protein VII95_18490 [Terriglobales bacterium]
MTSHNSSLPTHIDQELLLLETLKELLTVAMRSLSGGEAGNLVEASRQISSTADDLMALASRLGHLPLTPEEQQQRRKLLAELGQQRSFCRTMLRRWRRPIFLRQQLLALHDEPETCADSMEVRWS